MRKYLQIFCIFLLLTVDVSSQSLLCVSQVGQSQGTSVPATQQAFTATFTQVVTNGSGSGFYHNVVTSNPGNFVIENHVNATRIEFINIKFNGQSIGSKFYMNGPFVTNFTQKLKLNGNIATIINNQIDSIVCAPNPGISSAFILTHMSTTIPYNATHQSLIVCTSFSATGLALYHTDQRLRARAWGINESEEVSMFPNPTTNGQFSVRGGEVLRILNSEGKVVQKGDHLPPGVYFTKIRTGGGIVSKKLLVK